MLTETMSCSIRSLSIIFVVCILAVPSFASQIIEGRVVDAATGEAISGVKVQIFPADGPPANGFATATDAQGRFRIEGVKAGVYRAMYSAAGYSPMPDAGALPPPFPVVDGGESVRLEVKLQPMARISGRVLDATGKPVPNASIWLIRQNKWCMPPECNPDHRQSKTGENGEFAVHDLVPGPWLVAATAPATWDPPQSRGDERLGWAQTFFPGVTDPRLAEAVHLQPGGEQWSTNIKLATAPLHHIRGRLLDSRGDPVARSSVVLGKGFGPTFTRDTDSDGSFDFSAVEDEWNLSAAIDRNGVKLKYARMVDLKDYDSDGVEMRLSAPFTIRGKIVMEVPDGAPVPEPPPIDMGLAAVAPLLSDGPGGFLVIRTDGESLTVQDVYPGSYRVQFLTDAPIPYFLDSIRLGKQDALGSFPLDSAALPLTVRFKLGGGTVRGTVEDCGSLPVFLVPQEPALRRNGFIRISRCDSNNRFEFFAVRPGEYYGIALAKAPQSFGDLADERLLGQGSRVTVRPNESTSAELRISGQ